VLDEGPCVSEGNFKREKGLANKKEGVKRREEESSLKNLWLNGEVFLEN